MARLRGWSHVSQMLHEEALGQDGDVREGVDIRCP